jgi:cyclase
MQRRQPTFIARPRRFAATLALALVVAICFPAHARAQTELDRVKADGRDIRMTVIADGIYQFMTMRDSYVRQLNSVAIVNQNDVLVFDTNTRPSSARAILAEIRKITDKPVKFVVYSHGHPDHCSGTEVYADADPDLEVIATETTRDFMVRMASVWGPRFSTELARRRKALADGVAAGTGVDGTKITPEQRRQEESDVEEYAKFTDETLQLRRIFPTRTFGDSLTFFHGGREFRLFSVTGDAEGTTVLYLPAEKVLITGDAVSFPIPYVSGNPRAQAKDLQRLAAMDVAVIVPGHGPAFHDKAFLKLELQLIESVLTGVADARREGVTTVEDMQRRVTVDELRQAFTHGDTDLEARFRSRVATLVGFAMNEGAK